MSKPALPPARHELKDIRFRYMAMAAGLMILAVVLIATISWVVFPRSALDLRYAGPVPDYPRPRLQPSPRADMRVFYEQEMQRLDSAGWVDRAQGVVHIPIGDAMRLVAKEGIPDWPGQKKSEASR